MRKVTHTGTIEIDGAIITAHVLDDGDRVFPLRSAARLIGGSDDRTLDQMMTEPLVDRNHAQRVRREVRDNLDLGSGTTRQAVSTNALTDLLLEIAATDPHSILETWQARFGSVR